MKTKLPYFIFFLFLLLNYSTINAQLQYKWGFSSDGSGMGYTTHSAVDKNGNLIITGECDGGDIDPGAGYVTYGAWIPFLAKYDKAGNLLFSRPIDFGNNQCNVIDLKVDANNNILCSFAASGIFIADTVGGNDTLVFNNSIGIIKLSNNGNFLQSFQYENPYATLATGLIETDHKGGFIMSGVIEDTIADLDPTSGVYNFNSINKRSGFILKIDSTGNLVYIKTFTSSTTFYPNGLWAWEISNDLNDNIFWTGEFRGLVDFDPGPGTQILNGLPDINNNDPTFVLKLDSNGNYLNSFQYPHVSILPVLIDSTNNIWICGSTDGSFDIDPGPQVHTINSTGIAGTFFLVKFDSAMNFISSKEADYNSTNLGFGYLDKNGFYFYLIPSATIPQNNFGIPQFTSTPNSIYLIRLNNEGQYMYHYEAGNDNNSIYPAEIISNGDSLVYVMSRMGSACDIDITSSIHVDAPANQLSDEFVITCYKSDFNLNRISGNAFIDVNANGIKDSTEFPLANAIVKIDPANVYCATDAAGSYNYYCDTGNFSLSIPALPVNFIAVAPTTNNATFLASNQIDSNNNFLFVPIQNRVDANIELTTLTAVRPGFEALLNINYSNHGIITLNDKLTLLLDSSLNYLSSSLAPDSINGNTLIWNYTNLIPFQNLNFEVKVKVDSLTNLNDTLKNYASIFPINGDFNPVDNLDSTIDIVTGSYDPNSKEVSPSNLINKDSVASGQYLNYTIRFQNLGNDTAFKVVILDTLSANLDLSSFEITGYSHPYIFNLYQGNVASFTFNGINLPDTLKDELNSHGFIKYRIKCLPSLVAGSEIKNQAFIYFDYNQPVKTNEVVNQVYSITSVNNLSSTNLDLITVFPNPFNSKLSIELHSQLSNNVVVRLFNATGELVFNKKMNAVNRFDLDLSSLKSGLYLILVADEKQIFSKKIIKK